MNSVCSTVFIFPRIFILGLFFFILNCLEEENSYGKMGKAHFLTFNDKGQAKYG